MFKRTDCFNVISIWLFVFTFFFIFRHCDYTFQPNDQQATTSTFYVEPATRMTLCNVAAPSLYPTVSTQTSQEHHTSVLTSLKPHLFQPQAPVPEDLHRDLGRGNSPRSLRHAERGRTNIMLQDYGKRMNYTRHHAKGTRHTRKNIMNEWKVRS